jgi:hypothetical protein
MTATLRLDRLVGREVHTAAKARVGRLEEFRAVRRGNTWVVTDFVIGAAGLMERLGLGLRQILGMKRAGGYVARWDQLDLSDPDHPRLTCAVEELRRAEGAG